MDLANLEPTYISKGLSGKYICIYGPAKIGKTTLASQFPKTLLLACEPGYNALSKIFAQPITKWADIKTAAKQLISNPAVREKFDNVAIDTADIAWEMVETYVANDADVKEIADIAWGKGYARCKKEFQDVFRNIAMAGYGLIFISHEQEREVKEIVVNDAGKKEIKTVKKICPSLPERPRAIINKMVDIIGYIKPVRMESGDIKRYLLTRDTLAYEAGSRFKYLADSIELSYDNIINAVNEAIDKEAQSTNTETSQIAVNRYSNNSFAEFNILFNEIKDLWGKATDERKKEVSKFLEKTLGRKVKISELTEEQTDLLEVLKQKFEE